MQAGAETRTFFAQSRTFFELNTIAQTRTFFIVQFRTFFRLNSHEGTVRHIGGFAYARLG